MTANAIETECLTRRFGPRTAVDGLTLAIPAGTVFGFLGPNGAGKTTTVRLLAGLIAPSSGGARVAGYRLGERDAALRRAVGILTETPGLYDRLDPWHNLRFFGRLYGLDDRRVAAQIERYLTIFGLWERRHEPIGGFSKGMRQKVAIARALLHEPAVVFLDEPTAALDPEAARTVRDVVKDLRAAGRTIFLTTHNLNEAEELCDLIGVFRSRLLRLDTPAGLRASLFGRGTIVRFTGPAAAWAAAAQEAPGVRAVTANDGALTVMLDDPEAHNPGLIRALVAAGAPVRYVEPATGSLEDAYLALVEGG
ncbi:MAG: ATP-binding cassette domain-containing protein [Thermomicrobiales bacterium]|jgi:ABC-2 type transport system ATP-binding protein|nr:ABC transporter ATP-binding protein [Thermomicrobiales bacterium]